MGTRRGARVPLRAKGALRGSGHESIKDGWGKGRFLRARPSGGLSEGHLIYGPAPPRPELCYHQPVVQKMQDTVKNSNRGPVCNSNEKFQDGAPTALHSAGAPQAWGPQGLHRPSAHQVSPSGGLETRGEGHRW